MEACLTIGDLSRQTGCTLRAIRFYEEQGLLVPAVVSDGGHRRYTAEGLERLRLIADLRELGLPLADIRTALQLRSGCGSALELAERFRGVLREHIAQAELRLGRLRRVRRELQAALGAIEKRLSCTPSGCPCEVADPGAVPRIVRQVAADRLCRPPGAGEGDGTA